jgi:hypothetical protein
LKPSVHIEQCALGSSGQDGILGMPLGCFGGNSP